MRLKDLLQAVAGSLGYVIARKETIDQLLAGAEERSRVGTTSTSAVPDASAIPIPDEIDLDDDPSEVANGHVSPVPLLTDYDNLSAEGHFVQGHACLRAGEEARAFQHFARAMALVPRYEPAMQEMKRISAASMASAQHLLPLSPRRTVEFLVRAIECDPTNAEARDLLRRLLDKRSAPDLTTMCFIFYDGERARQIHSEAYKRALEFVTIGGVIGEVLEFGVLGGWSARLFCEAMRDIGNYGRVYLFDSFDGLPDYETEIDRTSYEIAGRKIWGDKMRFPDSLLRRFKVPHEVHIRNRLGEIISKDRIVVKRGFYAESLKEDLGLRASIVHIDCDLYQSTAEVLTGLDRMNAFQDGTVLIFDDWNCNRGNPNFGERKALAEFLESQPRYTASQWFSYGYNGMVYILHDRSV